jgi:hypothetical protein
VQLTDRFSAFTYEAYGVYEVAKYRRQKVHTGQKYGKLQWIALSFCGRGITSKDILSFIP